MKESPLENLRGKLEETRRLLGDIIVPNSKKLQENCEKFITLRQEIQELIGELTNLKVPIEPELVRLQEIDSIAKSNIRILNKGLRNSSLLSKASYPREFWWWHVPEIIEEERKKKLKRILTLSSIIGIIIIVLLLFFTFYKTPEEEILNTFSYVDKLVKERKYGEAEKEMIKLTEKFPTKAEVWIKLGTIQEIKGSPESIKTFEKAKKLYKTEEEFYLHRATEYLREGKLEKAEKDINEVLRKNKEHPQALYILGSIYEEQGKILEAISVYKKIDSLGDKVDPQLIAMIRIRLGLLMQKIPITIPTK